MQAPLRIRRADRQPDRQAASGAADSYVSRLTKLIPAEVVTAYVAGLDLARDNDFGPEWTLACLVATVLFRALMTFEAPAGSTGLARLIGGVQWPAVLIASVSFLFWAWALGERLPAPAPGVPDWLASLLLLLWTPLVPLVFRGAEVGRRPAES